MKYTKKTDYTNQQLQDALLEAIEEKPFEKVTVNDIVDHIHVNRSTFYRYYEDKYELLEAIEGRLLDDIDVVRNQFDAPSLLVATDFHQTSQAGLAFYQEHAKEFHALLGPNGDRSFEAKLEQNFANRYRQLVQDGRYELELTRLAITAMVMRILKYWLFNASRVSVEQLSTVLDALIRQGPLQYIRQLDSLQND